jgi:2-keto-4-pentenoate hydratase/2-oxohepta-3-ene-1,7-dioic acid hydratase in catechol pathway
MKYCRFEQDRKSRYGLIESVAGHETITGIIDPIHLSAKVQKFPSIRVDEAKLLAPVEPSKIVCIGCNYREHAAELGNEVPKEPLIILKPPSSLLDPGEQLCSRRFRTGLIMRASWAW